MKILPINDLIPKFKPIKMQASKVFSPIKNEQQDYVKIRTFRLWNKLKNLFRQKPNASHIQTTIAEQTKESVAKATDIELQKSNVIIPKDIISETPSKPLSIRKKEPIDEIQNKRIIELERIIEDPLLVDEFFTAYPDTDLNVKDKNGLTMFLRAVDRLDHKFIHRLEQISSRNSYNRGKYLRNYGKIDWEVVDKDGNNAAMRYLKNYYKQPDFMKQLDGVLIPKCNPKYINPKTKRTLLQEAIVLKNNDFIGSILNIFSHNPGTLDVNFTHPDTPPAPFLALIHNIASYNLSTLFTKYPVDLNAKYKGETIFENLLCKSCSNLPDKVMSKFETHLARKKLMQMKEYYEKEGIIDIDEILNYVKMPSFHNISNEHFNSIDENIGHFVASIVPQNFEEIQKTSKIIKILAYADYNFFSQDCVERIPLETALEAQNIVVAKQLLSVMNPAWVFRYRDDKAKYFCDKIVKSLKDNNINDPVIDKLMGDKFNSHYYFSKNRN